MNPKALRKILLLDFGFPMEINAVELIKKSLRHSISLLATFYCDLFHFEFSLKVLRSNFHMAESTVCLLKNYNVIAKKLDELDKLSEINEKVTIQDYKQVLKLSIETLLQEGNSMKTTVQVSILTKKRASLLRDILTDLVNKIRDGDKDVKNLLEKVNVIQITESESEKLKTPCVHRGNELVSWIICSENSQSLDILMKDLLLRREDRRQLKISLFKEINLTVTCDIEECMIKRPGFSVLFDEELRTKSNNSSMFGTTDSVHYMEVLFRIPLSGLCPTVVFGAPCRISPAQSGQQQPSEHQTNVQIFQALCRELCITEQGLLTKSNFQNEVNIFHVLTSDGCTLLLNNVMPFELYLPKHSETHSKFNHFTDQDADDIVKSSLRQVQFLEKYSPFEFRSGIYNYLESNIMRAVEKSTFLGNIDPAFKSQINQKIRKETYSVLKRNHNNKVEKARTIKESKPTKQLKLTLEKEYKNIHPALLPANLISKYGKGNTSAEEEVPNIFTLD